MGNDSFGDEGGGAGAGGGGGGEDLLLTKAELAAGDISSILRDSDLKKVEAL